jgi:WD40 repeat protein
MMAARCRSTSRSDPGGAQIADLAFSPDSKTLAVLDTNGQIFLWSVTGYQPSYSDIGDRRNRLFRA